MTLKKTTRNVMVKGITVEDFVIGTFAASVVKRGTREITEDSELKGYGYTICKSHKLTGRADDTAVVVRHENKENVQRKVGSCGTKMGLQLNRKNVKS